MNFKWLGDPPRCTSCLVPLLFALLVACLTKMMVLHVHVAVKVMIVTLAPLAWSFVIIVMPLLTFFRDLDRELVLMKGHQQYMHDKLALLEVSTNCSASKLVFVCSVRSVIFLGMKVFMTRWAKTWHIPHFMKIKIRPEIGISMFNCAAGKTVVVKAGAYIVSTDRKTSLRITFFEERISAVHSNMFLYFADLPVSSSLYGRYSSRAGLHNSV